MLAGYTNALIPDWLEKVEDASHGRTPRAGQILPAILRPPQPSELVALGILVGCQHGGGIQGGRASCGTTGLTFRNLQRGSRIVIWSLPERELSSSMGSSFCVFRSILERGRIEGSIGIEAADVARVVAISVGDRQLHGLVGLG